MPINRTKIVPKIQIDTSRTKKNKMKKINNIFCENGGNERDKEYLCEKKSVQRG